MPKLVKGVFRRIKQSATLDVYRIEIPNDGSIQGTIYHAKGSGLPPDQINLERTDIADGLQPGEDD